MSILNFLQSSRVEEAKVTAGRSGGGARKQWNPPPAIVALRVWKDGSVFPSQSAITKFDLEYRDAVIKKEEIKLKEGETAADQKYRSVYEFPKGTGNGLDVIDSRVWQQIAAGSGAMLFVAVVPKNAGKVDLFNTVAYDAENGGKPKVSVLDQGTKTFGEQVLVPAIQEVYGIKFNRPAKEADDEGPAQTEITDGVDFVDLAIFESIGEGDAKFNVTEQYSTKIIFAPKRITRGTDKGKADYTRRENVKVYGLAPASEVLKGYSSEAPTEATAPQGNTPGPAATV